MIFEVVALGGVDQGSHRPLMLRLMSCRGKSRVGVAERQVPSCLARHEGAIIPRSPESAQRVRPQFLLIEVRMCSA